MGDPVTATALTLGSYALAAYGAVDQADNARRQAHYQADQTQADADAAAGEATVQAQQILKQGDAERAQARAQLAASGVDVGEGTPIAIDKKVTQDNAFDAITATLSGAARQRAGYGQAAALRIGGANAQKAGYINAASTALGAAGQLYRTGYRGTTPATPDPGATGESVYGGHGPLYGTGASGGLRQ